MTTESAARSPSRLIPIVPATLARGGLVAGLAGIALTLAAAVVSVPLGFRPVVVHGGSMGDSIPAGSLVMARWTPAADLAVGDVIVVQENGGGPTVPHIHRIVSLEHDGTHSVVRTAGDDNQAVDPQLYVVPDRALRYSYHVPYVGYLLAFVTSILGWAVLILLPAIGVSLVTLHWIWFPARRREALRLEPNRS